LLGLLQGFLAQFFLGFDVAHVSVVCWVNSATS
jgi:hypothetical protein